MSKTLALCIPAYNASAYLPRLLNSAHKQFIPFDEILVYNDCSQDDTAVVAETLGAKVITGNVNKGCSIGKNTLAELTNCDWIHFHDADDELLPNFTSLAHKWLNRATCPDVVLFNYEYRDNDSNELLLTRRFSRKEVESDPIAYSIKEQINPFCGLYKKTSFLKAGGYDTDPAVLYNEDCAMHINLALNGLTFSAEEEISIINYRIKNSMSGANALKCLKAEFKVTTKTIQRLDSKNLLSPYKEVLSEKLWKLAGNFGAYKEFGELKASIGRALELGTKYPKKSNFIFRTLCSIKASWAFMLRERLIRLLRPELRAFTKSN